MEIKVVSGWFDAELHNVKQGFNLSLFKALNPPWMPAKVVRFDGCSPGDVVRLKLGLWPIQMDWESQITEEKTGLDAWYFVDEGVLLPFFLQKWTHVHRVESQHGRCRVIDHIELEFRSGFWAWLLMPLMRQQFAYRKPIYAKRLWGAPSAS
jgi:ligand-binding SRPBCC domain-containing protein